jgi:hypothetical protein
VYPPSNGTTAWELDCALPKERAAAYASLGKLMKTNVSTTSQTKHRARTRFTGFLLFTSIQKFS